MAKVVTILGSVSIISSTKTATVLSLDDGCVVSGLEQQQAAGGASLSGSSVCRRCGGSKIFEGTRKDGTTVTGKCMACSGKGFQSSEDIARDAEYRKLEDADAQVRLAAWKAKKAASMTTQAG